jgi:hypothetical protein
MIAKHENIGILVERYAPARIQITDFSVIIAGVIDGGLIFGGYNEILTVWRVGYVFARGLECPYGRACSAVIYGY